MIVKRLSAAIAAAVLMTTAVQATELKLADFQPPSHFVVGQVYEPMAARIAADTNNEVTIKLFMGGELGPGPGEQYNRAVDGVTDIAFGLPGYTASNFQKTLLTELPGVLSADTGTAAMLDRADLIADEFKRVTLLGIWNNAPNVIFTASKPIRALEDLKGLKIRVPSRNAGLVVEAWGATPVSMPAPEIYNAMQTGVIDGAMTDPSTLGGFKLGEVTNYITMGMDTTISSFFLIMNRDSFAALSDDQQKAVMAAGREAAMNGQKAWSEVSAKALAGFKDTAGKEVIMLSDDEAAKFNAASAVVVEKAIADAEAAGIAAKAYVDALKAQ
ncbi:MAG: TRAP transporter substrate-binding protein [Rhodobiaceae bacterium]|nr:TRAP transporter substrate-binding protein [Rhodobiaceae bacterium]